MVTITPYSEKTIMRYLEARQMDSQRPIQRGAKDIKGQ